MIRRSVDNMSDDMIILLGMLILNLIIIFLLWFFFYGLDIIKRVMKQLRK